MIPPPPPLAPAVKLIIDIYDKRDIYNGASDQMLRVKDVRLSV